MSAVPITTPPVPNDPGAFISLQGVGKHYGEGDATVDAIGSVTLDIRQGEFVSIVGPSGCGKSSLLQIVAGLLAGSRGTVHIAGRPVTEPPASLVYLFQQYSRSLFPWMTARENVRFAFEHHGRLDRKASDERCEKYLSMVGLRDNINRYPWEMSGGMQQRLAIARALAAEPKVLLLDEPFSAVDALTRMELHDLMLRLWKMTGLTILLVTHDVDEAVFLSDRIALLSPRPTQIAAVYTNHLPRPRHQVSTREEPEFLALRNQLLRRLLGAPAES
ncbi:MAG: transporter related protein [Herminiimonas sp.]|nr:transporter related protein [Herminiimonas sp.]